MFYRLKIGFLFNDYFMKGQPILRRMTDKLVMLEKPYMAEWLGGSIIVPEGYLCDLSSIPRCIQNILPKTGLHDGPSVIHDFCYERHWMNDRKLCDYLFLRCMKVAGVHKVRRSILWAGVRIGGWWPWLKKRSSRRRR